MGKSKDKRKAKGLRVIWSILGCFFIFGCGMTAVSKAVPTQTSDLDEKQEETPVFSDEQSQDSLTAEGTLEVHFIDVGQGDSTLVICNGHAMLIDAGNNYKGTTVQLYLKKQNIDSLDAVIWTHPDVDHIGGADVITTKYNIGTIYMPSITADTKIYEELIDAIAYRNYTITAPPIGSSFELGGAVVTFLGPETTYPGDNNNSIVCMIQFGSNKFLFTGDAEEEAESALVSTYADLSADVYKVGHHGSRTASSAKLLNAVNPTYAVISCGEDNTYGHPHAEVLNRLRNMGIKVFRTDEQGSIIATSDGTNITWNAEPSDTWKEGEKTESETISDSEQNSANETISDSVQNSVNETISDNVQSSVNVTVPDNAQSSAYGTAPEGAVYIGNTTNNKLHKASCSGLPQSQNQVLFDTLEEAQAAGYTKDNQCKRCYPYGKS
jgi:competence protein ComEC